MRTQNKFWWFVGVATFALLIALSTIGLLFWHQLTIDQRLFLKDIIVQHFAYFFSTGVLLLAAFGFTIDWFFRFYVLPARQLVEQTQLIRTVNPDLQLEIEGSHDLVWLAETINKMCARRFAEKDVQEDLKYGSISAQERLEKRILETILDQHSAGVIICNLDGTIVFYNQNAKRFLGIAHAGLEGKLDMNLVGLGRSLYDFVDRNCLQNALERISNKIALDDPNPVEYLLVGSGSEGLIQAELIAVVDQQHHLTGFILLLTNIQTQLEQHLKEEENLKGITGVLADTASILTLARDMLGETAEIAQLRDCLDNAICKLNELMVRSKGRLKKLPGHLHSIAPVCVGDWASTLAQTLKNETGLEMLLELEDAEQWLKVDYCAINSSMIKIFQNFREKWGNRVKCKISSEENICVIDFLVHAEGMFLDLDKLNELLAENSSSSSEFGASLPIITVLDYHGAELFPIYNKDNLIIGIRLMLPTEANSSLSSCAIDRQKITVLPESRPVFYDFDLFNQPGQIPEIDNRPLIELVYTVFDTETTGLDPRGGDEIISIGAVRIVNGKLLLEEKFDQLIDPCRDLPWESIKFHGIKPEMLEGQPTINEVLPKFHRFAKDTVLVAHNAAFDMRMLQVKEEQTGVKFINPVLDTMHLSAVVHPAHTSHRLGDIAQRLGVTIKGRHTALGDALATAEIFIKLIPLLREKGINTLKEARMASQKTYYARLKY